MNHRDDVFSEINLTGRVLDKREHALAQSSGCEQGPSSEVGSWQYPLLLACSSRQYFPAGLHQVTRATCQQFAATSVCKG